jgi:hypothetical protein
MMLRQAVFSIASKRSAIPLRHFATAATTGPKRALNKQQIVETPPSNTPPVPPPPPPPVPPSGDGVASGLVAPALGIATVIAGGAYYFDVFGLKEEAKQTAAPTTEPAKEDVSEDPVYEVKSEGIGDLLEEATQEEEPSPAAEDPVHEVKTTGGAAEEPPASERGPAAGNRVLEINVPQVTQREVPPVRVIEHPASGNRVEMHVNKPKEKVPTAMDAAKELLKPEQRAAALEAAYKAIRVTQDTSLFEDLDHLTPSELKVRVVQLASEMKNQTKWEAVRLQEHLARKEKEVAEK